MKKKEAPKLKKYFVVSDIHGFYKPLMTALKEAGFQTINPNHVLIVCGDIFDRGPDSVKVYEFLRSLPKERRVLIRGNHEYLLRDAVNRGYFCSHDIYNGTVQTIGQFLDAKYPDSVIRDISVGINLFRETGVLDWIFGDEWVNFFEIDNYVFVHSWVPVENPKNIPIYNMSDYSVLKKRDDWRFAHAIDWEDATWGCPWMMWKYDLLPDDRTLVCGHWRVDEIRKELEPEDHGSASPRNYDLYMANRFIALDACTVLSGKCNVFSFASDSDASAR